MAIYDFTGPSPFDLALAQYDAIADAIQEDLQPLKDRLLPLQESIAAVIDDYHAFSDQYMPHASADSAQGLSGASHPSALLVAAGASALTVLAFGAYEVQRAFERRVPPEVPGFADIPTSDKDASTTLSPIAADKSVEEKRKELTEKIHEAHTAPMRKGETDSDRQGELDTLTRRRERLDRTGRD